MTTTQTAAEIRALATSGNVTDWAALFARADALIPLAETDAEREQAVRLADFVASRWVG